MVAQWFLSKNESDSVDFRGYRRSPSRFLTLTELPSLFRAQIEINVVKKDSAEIIEGRRTSTKAVSWSPEVGELVVGGSNAAGVDLE